MATRLKRALPSNMTAEEKAEVIEHFFPALMTYWSDTHNCYLAPSAKERTKRYKVHVICSPDGIWEARCSCEAAENGARCRHVINLEALLTSSDQASVAV